MPKRGRPTVRVTVSPSERTTLEQWARRRTTEEGLAQRVQIVLACAAGRSNSEIATELRIRRQAVGRWRRRFAAKRLDGLVDEPRPGTRAGSATLSRASDYGRAGKDRAGCHAVEHADVGEGTRADSRTVGRIWRAFGLQPRRSETFKLSRDPLFIEKVRDIIGLYLAPPNRALVLSVDEKNQIRALDRTAPFLPTMFGSPERRTHDYRRHGTTSLFAALERVA